MKHIYLKLTVKYMSIYTSFYKVVKAKKAICNIPLNPIISDQCNKLSMTSPFRSKKKNHLKTTS